LGGTGNKINPMPATNEYYFGQRFESGFCPEANTSLAPIFVFEHRLNFDY